MSPKHTSPSTNLVAFNCPHCGAYTSQEWFRFNATALSGERRTPSIIDPNDVLATQLFNAFSRGKTEMAQELEAGHVVLDKTDKVKQSQIDVFNLHASECFACQKISVWIHNNLLWPSARSGPPPNSDLPPDVLRDYEEARVILNLSPRGAAALLRLAIQKLCVVLGEKGKNIDDDIASLVRKGLPPTIQKALDAVRVIGNEAVHPGTLDLKDDTDTTNSMFQLVNIIAEQMISNPRHINEMYSRIPASKLQAIDKRDGASPKPKGSG